MHQAVQDGAAHGGVTQIFTPVLDHALGCNNNGEAQFVALMHDRLKQLSAHLDNVSASINAGASQRMLRNPTNNEQNYDLTTGLERDTYVYPFVCPQSQNEERT